MDQEAAEAVDDASAGGVADQPEAGDGQGNWSDVLLTLIPGEVTAVYLGIRSTVAMIGESAEDIGAYVPFVLLFSILLLTILTPMIAIKIRASSFQVGCFVALSFFIWSTNIDYNRMLELVFLLEQPLLTAIVSYLIPISMIIWAGLAVPVFAQIYQSSSATQEAE